MNLNVKICFFFIVATSVKFNEHIEGKRLKASESSFITEYCQIGLRKKAFEPKYQYCCEGHIRKKKHRNDRICCAKELPDTALHATLTQCCNKSEISLNSLKRAGCCHDELYDEEKYMCYGGLVLSKKQLQSFSERKSNIPRYNKNFEDANYKEEIQLMTKPLPSNTLTYIAIGCSLVIVCFVTSLIIWHRYKTKTHSSSNETSESKVEEPGSVAANIESVYINRFVADVPNMKYVDNHENHSNVSAVERAEIRYNENNIVVKSNTNKRNTTINSSNNEQTNTASQTGPTKDYNLINSMGKPFCCRHVFTPATKSLQLPYSSVKLTLSEQDSVNGTLECFASSFSCLHDVYSKLQDVITAEETIVSPAVEYVFPCESSLKEFAIVEMEIGRSGRDLHVWKIKSDQGKSKVQRRQEILLKEYVDVNDKNLDAYYEMIEPGKIRIYIKRFCWLVCTVCQGEHYGFSLAAYIYMCTVPQNNLSKKVRLTVYILDDVQQLKDYRKCLHEDENNLKLVRNIQLPLRVKLEDNLTFRFRLFEETQKLWVLQESYQALSDHQTVVLHRITKCHKQKSNNQPFAIDMHLVSRPCFINADTFIFEGVINITLDPAPPGILEEIPDNAFTVAHEVDFSTVKKTAPYNMFATAPNPVSHFQQLEYAMQYPQQQGVNNPSQPARQKSSRRETTAVDMQLCIHQSQLVRAESESNIMANSIGEHGPRNVTPCPELSQTNETNAFQALPFIDMQGNDGSQKPNTGHCYKDS